MAKLTVYLSDELAGQVKAAGLSASPICQRALEGALAGPKVTVLTGGWCRVSLDQAEMMVRFVAGMYGGALLAREVVAAAPFLTGRTLADLPVAALESWANGEALTDLLQAIKDRDGMDAATLASQDAQRRSEPARRVEWGTEPEAIADIRPKGDQRDPGPITFGRSG